MYWKTTSDGRRPLTEDNLSGRRSLTEDDLWQKTTFDRRRPLTEDDLWRRRTYDGRRPLTEDDLQWKTTFDRVYSILPEKNVFDSSPWQPQHNWPQTGNPISCLNRKKNFPWWKKWTRHHTCASVQKRRHFEAKTTKHPWCIIHRASCIMHHASCIIHHASCIRKWSPPP